MTASLLLSLPLSAAPFAAAAPPPPAPKPAEAAFGLPATTEFYWPFYVLESPGVRKELGLTAAQVAKLDALRPAIQKRVEAGLDLPPGRLPAHRKEFGAWLDRSVAGVLTAGQLPRYRQVVWQVLEFNDGPVALAANPVFARELGLTADQARKARQVEADYARAWDRLVRANPGRAGPLPGEEALVAKANETALKLLTADQKKKWDEVLGKPYGGEITPLPIPNQPPRAFKAPTAKS